MGRSGKLKKSKLSQNVSRNIARSRSGLPLPDKDSIVVGIFDEVLLYYVPKENKLFTVDIHLGFETDGDYAENEDYGEAEALLVEKIAKTLKEGGSLKDISVAYENEVDAYSGPSHDRTEQIFREETIAVSCYADINENSEVWFEDDPEAVLKLFKNKESDQVREMMKEANERALKKKRDKASANQGIKKPGEDSILSKADFSKKGR